MNSLTLLDILAIVPFAALVLFGLMALAGHVKGDW